jgi:hypothetical protein
MGVATVPPIIKEDKIKSIRQALMMHTAFLVFSSVMISPDSPNHAEWEDAFNDCGTQEMIVNTQYDVF